MEKLRQLLKKWHEGKLTAAEQAELDNLFESIHFDDIESLTEEEFLEESYFNEKYEDILSRAKHKKSSARIITFKRLAIAAAMLLFVSAAALWFYSSNKSLNTNQVAQHPAIENINDVLPGQEGAILSLSGGEKIILDDAGEGEIASQGNTTIANKNGMLSYNSGNAASKEVIMNNLTTPAGRKYKLQLPDGSVVWLNASSSLSFPAEFTEKERRVSLQGEAYFEIVKSVKKDGTRIPFIVDIDTDHGNRHNVEMEVLGTSFNVNAYYDEKDIRTTLIEGSVRVHSDGATTMLTPSRQVIVSAEGSTTFASNVNLDKVVAWKNGQFYFDHDNISSILRQFSRWYNVKIEAEDGAKDRTFSGKIDRSTKLVDVLSIMDMSNIKYTIKDGKIIFNEDKNTP